MTHSNYHFTTVGVIRESLLLRTGNGILTAVFNSLSRIGNSLLSTMSIKSIKSMTSIHAVF
ncbi:MAG: hypothetical protein GY757_06115 [bacterium]|nr:hypothetical protein [bacterium]